MIFFNKKREKERERWNQSWQFSNRRIKFWYVFFNAWNSKKWKFVSPSENNLKKKKKKLFTNNYWNRGLLKISCIELYVVFSHVEIARNDFIGRIVRVIDGVDGFRLTCNRGEFKFRIVVEKAFAFRSGSPTGNQFRLFATHKFPYPSRPATIVLHSSETRKKNREKNHFLPSKTIPHWNYVTIVRRDKSVTKVKRCMYPTKQLHISSNEVCMKEWKNN